MEQTEKKAPSTRSIGIKFGLYSAGISVVLFLIPALLNQNPFQGLWNWIGIPILIALIVFAHKQFKDQGDGFMSFGQGVGIGFWLTLIATIVAGLFTFVYISFVDSSPMELMLQEQTAKMQEQGVPDETIEMAQTWTKNLFWPSYGFMGILGGVIIALIVSIFTQKKSAETNY